MSAAVVLAIVVAAGEASSPPTAALQLAAQESLGSSVAFRILEVPDVEVLDARALEETEGAQAVVVVAWRDAAHLSADVRLHLATAVKWRTRAVTFVPEDPLAERGRTLGLAVASMWPEQVLASANDESPPARGAGPPADRAHAGSIAAEGSGGAPGARPWFALGAAALGSMGVGGPALGVGGVIEGLLPVGNRFALRIGASLRGGPVSALPGTDLVAVLGAGVEWWPVARGRVGAGVRADLLAIHHQVTDVIGTTSESRDRSLPGADVLAQACLRVHGRFDLVAAVGLEGAFGGTDLRTGATPVVVASIPALRAISQIGVRVGF